MMPLVPYARQLQMVATKRADAQLFADDVGDFHRATLPAVAARDSARRRDTVCMRPLSRRERGAFLVEFEWLREELAR